MEEQGSTGVERALAITALFTLAAGDFWRHLIGWWGYGALALLLLVALITLLVRRGIPWRRIPVTLVAFHLVTIASITWSAYPGSTTLGAVITLATSIAALALVVILGWSEFIVCLSVALRWILGLSLLFEVYFGLTLPEGVRGVLPLWVDYSDLELIPGAYFWTQGLLFDGGRIQGIVGNANLLAMLALIGLILSLALLAARRGSPVWNVFWGLVALAALLLASSSTVFVALAAVVGVVGVALIVKRLRGAARLGVQLAAVVAGVVTVVVGVAARDEILALLGRSPDLTDRVDIWYLVGDFFAERPLAGWGWVGYWPPWEEMFDGLIVIEGITYLQAHNAWLDIAFQVGLLGLTVAVMFVVGCLARSWFAATEGGRSLLDGILPLALLVALLVQSLAESRLLLEWNWALLVVLALRGTLSSAPHDEPEPAPLRGATA